MSTAERRRRARQSLQCLALGDAFGGWFFGSHAERMIVGRQTPPGPWHYSDDTMMAISIVDVLSDYERIVQDELAARFARRFMQQPNRGYGGGATRLLRHIAAGGSWREAAAEMFNGQGSMGNGAAMRSAPIGRTSPTTSIRSCTKPLRPQKLRTHTRTARRAPSPWHWQRRC